jgi:hypothetical protein
MSRYAAAHAVNHVKRTRDHLKRAGICANVRVYLRNGGELSGRRTYLGTHAFGIRQADRSSRAIAYADVDYVIAPDTRMG